MTSREQYEECERELRYFKAALASTEDFFFVFDLEGKYTYANEATLELYEESMGLGRSDVIGKDFFELGYPAELAREYTDRIQEVIATGRSVRGEEILPVAAGGFRQFEYIFSPVYDEDGQVEAVSGITRDLTQFKETTAALQKSENLYRTLFESVDQGVGLLEVFHDEGGQIDFRWLEVNEVFAEQSGLKDPVGKRGRELTPDADEMWFESYRNVAEEREPTHFENYVRDTDRWFDVHAVPIGDPEFRRVAVLFSDITERKRREQNAALLDELHDDFTRLVDSEELMDSVGQKVAQYLGVSRITYSRLDEEAQWMTNLYDWRLEGMATASGVHRLSDFMSEKFIGDLKAGRPAAIEDVSTDERTADFGDAYRAFGVGSMLHVPHVSDGRWKFQLAIHHRGPHRWRVDEVQLMMEITKRLYWRLERAFAEEALREVDRRKDRFLAVLSHELRNPLTPIELSLRLLDQVGADSMQGRRARTVIDRQVKQLTRLVDDLLDVNRVNSDKVDLHLEHVELNELVTQTAEDHRPIFEKKGVRLKIHSFPESIFVDGDRNRLAQVIGNLLQNAAKFTAPGDGVEISLKSDAAGRAEIRVTDTGAGIEADLLADLFDPFVQADTSLDRSVGGLGLGLALVKRLVELHGGEVLAFSDGIGEGAEFVIRLPQVTTDDHAEINVDTRRRPSSGRTILVIEDSLDVAELLKTVLQFKGHHVEVAHSGPAGVEMARELMPDVVICDIGLPEMSGYEVAREFRADPALRNTYLIALSGYASSEDMEKSRRAGFDRHLSKPPKMEQLDRLLSGEEDDLSENS